MSLGKLTINLDLESVNFEKGLSKSEQQVQRFSRNFQLDMDKAVNSAKQFSQRTTEYLNNIEAATKNINRNTSLSFWSQIGGGLKAFGSDVVRFADSHTELANKIKLVTETQFQHAQAMAAVYDISMKTAQSTQAVSAVYQSFAQNAKELGINQRQVASVTETISKAVAISGASTAEAQNALTQFSQTLLMGKMRAQEYNSIMTQTPAVMQAIARGLGVTMGQLKEMSDKGELTTDKMIQGLEKSNPLMSFMVKRYLSEEQIKTNPTMTLADDCTVHFTPLVAGAGKNGNVLQIVAGVVLIVASLYVPALAPYASTLIGMGVSMVVSGTVGLLTKPPSMDTKLGDSDKQQSTSFSNLRNLTPQGRPIPLLYEKMMTSLILISQGIDTYDDNEQANVETSSDSGGAGGGFYWGVAT